MTDMIERVGNAIQHQMGLDDNMPEDLARAAIAAMRECTPEMLDAGSAAHPAGGYRRETLLNDIIECEWKAMVDAALEPCWEPVKQNEYIADYFAKYGPDALRKLLDEATPILTITMIDEALKEK
jgi:hypothetical protein